MWQTRLSREGGRVGWRYHHAQTGNVMLEGNGDMHIYEVAFFLFFTLCKVKHQYIHKSELRPVHNILVRICSALSTYWFCAISYGLC